MSAPVAPLTKSRFVTGHQCQKLLWWTVHEPEAEELKPDKVLLDRFDQGRHVTTLARTRFPNATLIPQGTREARIEATRLALDFGTPVILEAAFEADGVFVAADVLMRDAVPLPPQGAGDRGGGGGAAKGEGWTLMEVKSATKAKDEHIPDVAVQVYVAQKNGINVTRAMVMHLNTDFRHPDTGDLFAQTDITEQVGEFLPRVSPLISDFSSTISGPNPTVPIGLQCFEPWDCRFHDRCWPNDPWHISALYNTGPKKTAAYLNQGITSIRDLPADQKHPPAAARQIKALHAGQMIVEPALGDVLKKELGDARLGYLDFETINRAVPVWDGLGPWRAAVVQFSYHEQTVEVGVPLSRKGEGTGERRGDGTGEGVKGYRHEAYLAEGPHDPRPELAERMLEATKNAEKIVMYSSFERTRINELAVQVPALATDLTALAAKLVDLLPIVRNHVYHPDFCGSFSLKYILSPLVPDLTYNDLAIVDGQVASVEIARLLFVAHLVEDRDQLRKDLLAYCERDTWAMVRLVERLRELA